jgi:uncharacterized protein (DUF58 family)
LDWKVFGKTDRFFIREYEEETNLRCHMLLDASGSMGYQGDRAVSQSKLDYASRMAACLAYLILRQTDSVGLTTFDEKVRVQLPVRGGPSHIKNVIDQLSKTTVGGETDLGSVFHELAPKLKKRGLLLLFSDCFGELESILKGLAHFRHARHDIVIFQIWDRDELDFPFQNWTRFDCLEKNSLKHTVDPRHLREAYLKNLAIFRDGLTKGCHRHRITLVPMVTDQPYADGLGAFLAARNKIRKPGRL